ncbi:hypothetical protein HPP92_005140 [Vanilla planifolia]|uniref:Argonaute linker 1 domain-containing protein n=1 Tax=Vanilla planifolia TaxID=51239 RepID=A0A835VB01_VANPL|nr:hypothetical protein HPP92_005450 [Vanilla planifolia]KAG0494146.1 hypothetical protein HPP92_005140 [Vanilla planifolia]
MARGRRNEPGSGDGSNDSGSRESGFGGRGGAHYSPAMQQQGVTRHKQASHHLGGTSAKVGGSASQQQQGGRGEGHYKARGGQPTHGGFVHQQSTNMTMEYHPRGGQSRGEPLHYRGGFGGAAYVPGRHGAHLSAAEPTGLLLPELHQATQAPNEAAPVRLPVASSLSSDVAAVTLQVEQVSLKSEPAANQAVVPASSKSVRFPSRPGKGSYGAKCVVKANHFFAELPNKVLYQYDVSITPEVNSRARNRAVMEELVKLFKDSHLGGRLPVYDGRKSLYTAGPLPFTSKEFQVTLDDEDDGIRTERKQRNFRIVIKFAARADLHHLAMFLAGKQADAPQDALQILDIVLRELPTARYSSFARSFYSPHLGRRQPLGDGLESWQGFYQSIRPTQMGLSLNIDMSTTAFIEPLPVIDFVLQLLNRDAREVLSRPLSDSDRVKIKKALRGIKIEVTIVVIS